MAFDLGYLAAAVEMNLRLSQISNAIAAKLATDTGMAWKADGVRQADRFSIRLDSGIYRADIRGSIAMLYSELSASEIAAILAPHVLALQLVGKNGSLSTDITGAG